MSKNNTTPASHINQENGEGQELPYEVGNEVNTASRLTQLVKQIIRMIQSTLNASASSLLLFKDKEQELIFEFAYGPVGRALRRTRLNTISGIAGWVARNGKPVIVNTKSLICVPLIINHQVIGVIEVLNKLNGDDFIE